MFIWQNLSEIWFHCNLVTSLCQSDYLLHKLVAIFIFQKEQNGCAWSNWLRSFCKRILLFFSACYADSIHFSLPPSSLQSRLPSSLTWTIITIFSLVYSYLLALFYPILNIKVIFIFFFILTEYIFFIAFREREVWERNINPHMCLDWGPNVQPGCVPWPGIKPATFWPMGQ